MIIDDFYEMINHLGVPGRINFTGKDPLLKEEIFDILDYTQRKGITVGLLGNPEHLDYDTVSHLKELGVFRYQISIDGLEDTHDRIREKKGAFKEAIRAIHILKEVELPCVAMFTVSKENANELIDVIRLVAKEDVPIFDFARLSPVESGKQLGVLTSKEYHSLLLNVLEEYRLLQENGCKTRFG